MGAKIKASPEQRALGLDTYDVRMLAHAKRGDWWFSSSDRARDLEERGLLEGTLRLRRYSAASGSASYSKAYRITPAGRAALAARDGR